MIKHPEELMLSAYLDGETDARERDTVAAHLDQCPACRRTLEDLRRVKGFLAAAPRLPLPPFLLDDVEARVSWPERRAGAAFLERSRAWLPVCAALLAALAAAAWLGLRSRNQERDIPLAPLLAEHSRYWTDNLVPEASFASLSYSRQLTEYYGNQKSQGSQE